MLRGLTDQIRLWAFVGSDGAIEAPDLDSDTPAEIVKVQYREFCKIMKKTTITLTEIKAAIEHLNRLEDALKLHSSQQSPIVVDENQTPIFIDEESLAPIVDNELLKKFIKRLELIKTQLTQSALEWVSVPRSLREKIWDKCAQSWQCSPSLFSRKKPLPPRVSSIFPWGALPDEALRNVMFFLKVHEIAQVESVCKQWNKAGRDLYVPGISKIYGCLLHYNVAGKTVKFNPRLLKFLETPPKSQDSKEEKKPIVRQSLHIDDDASEGRMQIRWPSTPRS